jgi:hypothetical protein
VTHSKLCRHGRVGFRANGVADVDDAFAQDLSPQTSGVVQTAHDAMLREFLQILARLAKARAAHEHRTNAKFTVDEMIERDTGRRDVAASVSSGELYPGPFPLGVEHTAEDRANLP